jgi:hypothetical protein
MPGLVKYQGGESSTEQKNGATSFNIDGVPVQGEHFSDTLGLYQTDESIYI